MSKTYKLNEFQKEIVQVLKEHLYLEITEINDDVIDFINDCTPLIKMDNHGQWEINQKLISVMSIYYLEDGDFDEDMRISNKEAYREAVKTVTDRHALEEFDKMMSFKYLDIFDTFGDTLAATDLIIKLYERIEEKRSRRYSDCNDFYGDYYDMLNDMGLHE